MVDFCDRAPSPPGPFVLLVGQEIVLKRLEYVPYSHPPRVVLTGNKESDTPRELPLADVRIEGRVIGKWRAL